MLVDALNLLGIEGHPDPAGGNAHWPASTAACTARAAAPQNPEEYRRWRALAQADGELERSARSTWRRLMPCADQARYTCFLEEDRDLNRLPFRMHPAPQPTA